MKKLVATVVVFGGLLIGLVQVAIAEKPIVTKEKQDVDLTGRGYGIDCGDGLYDIIRVSNGRLSSRVTAVFKDGAEPPSFSHYIINTNAWAEAFGEITGEEYVMSYTNERVFNNNAGVEFPFEDAVFSLEQHWDFVSKGDAPNVRYRFAEQFTYANGQIIRSVVDESFECTG